MNIVIVTKKKRGVTSEKAVIISNTAWTVSKIRLQMSTSNVALTNGLLKIYDCQTHDEQQELVTKHTNSIGFSGADGEILSSFAQFYKRNGYLSEKQLSFCRKKMAKYSTQIFNLLVLSGIGDTVRIQKQ